MRNRCIACFIAGAFMLTSFASAQTAPPATTPAPAPAAPPAPSLYHEGGMDFSFMLDGYVNGNFNHPDSGTNQFRNFDFKADTAHINMGKITIDRAPSPVGFHLDVGFGQTFNLIHSTDRAPEAFKYFEQAYISVKPKSWKGGEID